MRPWTFQLLVTGALLATGGHAWAGGGIYRYVEKDGTVVYTNVRPVGKKARLLKGAFHRAPSAAEPPIAKAEVMADYEDYLRAAAKRYRIPLNLLRAVMHAESNFDPHAVSPQGASGLMQLMPATAQEMYVRDIFDVRQNIEGGARYLRLLANLYDGDMVKMVAAYNAGPDAVNKFGGAVPPYEETQSYVRKVIQLYFQYKEQSRLAASEPR
jgi:soluble lytic murein transglycosylase-like protein